MGDNRTYSTYNSATKRPTICSVLRFVEVLGMLSLCGSKSKSRSDIVGGDLIEQDEFNLAISAICRWPTLTKSTKLVIYSAHNPTFDEIIDGIHFSSGSHISPHRITAHSQNSSTSNSVPTIASQLQRSRQHASSSRSCRHRH